MVEYRVVEAVKLAVDAGVVDASRRKYDARRKDDELLKRESHHHQPEQKEVGWTELFVQLWIVRFLFHLLWIPGNGCYSTEAHLCSSFLLVRRKKETELWIAVQISEQLKLVALAGRQAAGPLLSRDVEDSPARLAYKRGEGGTAFSRNGHLLPEIIRTKFLSMCLFVTERNQCPKIFVEPEVVSY